MGYDAGVLEQAGWSGMFSIFVTLGCVVVAWVVLQDVKWDNWLKDPKGPKARFLQLLVSIGLGYLLAGFILDYWNWVGTLRYLFGGT